MKKILLSLSAAVACMSMSAAVPTLKDLNNGSFNVTQETPNYSNPSAYDANGNLIITGAFNDVFGDLEAIGTSAYIVKYNSSNTQEWAVALTGSATITAIDTDAAGNIYVAGTLADIVEFGSADGNSGGVGSGLMIDGEFTIGQNASFLAKYSAAGEVLGIRTFVPQPLPELSATGMYYPNDGDIVFTLNNIKVDGERVYASASYRGQTEIDGVLFNGTYADPWGGVYFIDYKNAGVFSLDCNSLRSCKSEVLFECDGPFFSDEAVDLYSISFTVDNEEVFAGITAGGNAGNKIKVINESRGYDMTLVNFDQGGNKFIFTSAYGTGVLNHESPTLYRHLENVAGMYINNDKIYAVCTAMERMPSLMSLGTNNTMGMSDVFVAVSDKGYNDIEIFENINDEGFSEITNSDNITEFKSNYELAKSAKFVDNTLYINTKVYNANNNFVKIGTISFYDFAYTWNNVG